MVGLYIPSYLSLTNVPYKIATCIIHIAGLCSNDIHIHVCTAAYNYVFASLHTTVAEF